MSPKFGTSGLRGLVADLTPDLVTGYVQAFVRGCDVGQAIYLGRDLRASSPAIAAVVADAVRACGVRVVDCGAVPTPALAMAAMQAGAGAVMVTGSHIPADRNGLKFYTPEGEITKAHEALILDGLANDRLCLSADLDVMPDAGAQYVARYVAAFGAVLDGMRLGVYSHSTVGRDLLIDVLRGCGADVTELGRSDTFIPVDTEAVSADMRAALVQWAQGGAYDAIASMDGDGDRPLLTDATGAIIPGDVLGQITGAWLGADVAVTPVSSNTGAEAQFARVLRTRIGSPYVIAGMEATGGKVVGYEANGGFLLGFAANGPAGVLAPLMTRDAVLPLLVPLVAAKGRPLAALVIGQPARFTVTDRIEGMPTDVTQAFMALLDTDFAQRAAFLADMDGIEAAVDRTDGLRITLVDGRIVHLRPSGNAPELRFYAEAATRDIAAQTVARGLDVLRQLLG